MLRAYPEDFIFEEHQVLVAAHGSSLRQAASSLAVHGRSRCDSRAQQLQLSGFVASQLVGS